MSKEKTELDMEAHYSVDGHGGVAWFLRGYATEQVPGTCYGQDDYGNEMEMECWETTEDRTRVVATMVGDDAKFTFDVEDIHEIAETDFCRSCGQIGCGHNVYE